MRIAQSEIELTTLEVRLEADPLNLEFLDVTIRNALDHTSNHRSRRAIHGISKTTVFSRGEGNYFVSDGHFNDRRKRFLYFALRALNEDRFTGNSDFYLVRDRNGLFADAAHFIRVASGSGLGRLPDVTDQFTTGLVTAAVGVFH